MSRKLYVITRLFNVNDRLASLDLSDEIDSLIDTGVLADFEHNFLPYRDSNNTIDPDLPTYEQAIFDLDVEHMRNECSGVIGYFDGAGYDSGCAWELGFSYSLGYPINIITTDMFEWSVGPSDDTFVGSRVLEYIAKVVHITDVDSSLTTYREQQEDLRNRNTEALKENLIAEFGTIKEPVPMSALPILYDYYIDPNFLYTEPARAILLQIISLLIEKGKTFVIGNNQDDIASDIVRLQSCGSSIFYTDPAFEPNMDSGILQGIAFGIDRPGFIYNSNQQWHTNAANDRVYKNLMVRYGGAGMVTSIEELGQMI